MEKITLRLTEEKHLVLNIGTFDDEIDVDSLLRIDYSNLIAEILTFPVIVNRFGLILADYNSKVAESELDLKINKSKIKERLRKEFVAKGKKVTGDIIDDATRADPVYKIKNTIWIKRIKERDYINSIYWSAKDKSDKLDKMSLTIKSGDVDDKLVEGQLNNIRYKITKAMMR